MRIRTVLLRIRAVLMRRRTALMRIRILRRHKSNALPGIRGTEWSAGASPCGSVKSFFECEDRALLPGRVVECSWVHYSRPRESAEDVVVRRDRIDDGLASRNVRAPGKDGKDLHPPWKTGNATPFVNSPPSVPPPRCEGDMSFTPLNLVGRPHTHGFSPLSSRKYDMTPLCIPSVSKALLNQTSLNQHHRHQSRVSRHVPWAMMSIRGGSNLHSTYPHEGTIGGAHNGPRKPKSPTDDLPCRWPKCGAIRGRH